MNLQVNLNPTNTKVFVAGAGVMGMGIAQLAAQSGHSVLLYDVCQTRSQSAKESLGKTFQHLVSKEKLSSEEATRAFSSIELASDLADASQAGIVIEAIVEDRVEKRALFQSLEEFVSSKCILASNTSSLSITELGSRLNHPDRLLGMHFFNPAPVMKLVEVISGMQTSSDTLLIRWLIWSRPGERFLFVRIQLLDSSSIELRAHSMRKHWHCYRNEQLNL